MKYFLLIYSLLILPFTLYASQNDISKSKGTTQDVIVQLMPSPAQGDVSRYTKIEASFNIPLDVKHVKKFDVKLKCLSCKKKKNIKGTVTYSETENKVIFTPKEILIPGLYEVEFKSLKAEKSHKNTKIKEIKYRFVVVLDTTAPVITLNGEANLTLFQGGTYTELGASAMDDMDGDVNVTVSGSVDTSTEGTYTIRYSTTDRSGNKAEATRTVNVVIPQLVSLTLESNATSLNLGEKAALTVTGTYEDNRTKELTSDIEWSFTPTDSLEVNGTMLTVLKDVNTALQAKVGSILSNSLNLELYWEVNGYRLPPEPDPTVNNSTLLGIDSNDNGVRDDVERWIYTTYNHPIERGIFMQSARAYNLVIVDPGKAQETRKYISSIVGCIGYWKYYSKENNETYILDPFRDTSREINKIQFNTIMRHIAYKRFNGELSGGVYGSLGMTKDMCEFNEFGILGDIK